LEARVLERRARRRLEGDVDLAPVADRDEAEAAEEDLERERTDERADGDREHGEAVVERPGDDAAIAVGLAVEPAVEAGEHGGHAVAEDAEAAAGRCGRGAGAGPIGGDVAWRRTRWGIAARRPGWAARDVVRDRARRTACDV